MKTILTSLLAFSITSIAIAQNPDKALARVRYSFSHVQDTTQKDKPHLENMLLIIGKNASLYTSYDKINRNLDMENMIKEQMKNQEGVNNMRIDLTGRPMKKTSPLDYFFFANENKFFTKEKIFNDYLVEEEAPKINWKIKKDTASFSGVKCQKAIAYFKGRNWIAWFAPDMPFQSGPWKLNGLPGLIVEAVDETETVRFQFAGIENINPQETKAPEKESSKIMRSNGEFETTTIIGLGIDSYLGAEIKLPANAIKTSKKELDKLKAAREKDPQGFINAQMAAQGGSMSSVTTSSYAGGKPATKINLNNPIELPEKK